MAGLRMSDLIKIDGGEGEGGGQVIRSSLTLAMVTGRGVEITNIRAKRAKPGLLKQHLTAVQAAREVCGGGVTGAELGSQQLIFAPGEIQCRDFQFDIGSAGSTTLVAQTLIPALLTAPASSSIQVTGGTHNQAAPPYHFLEYVYLPLLNRLGGSLTSQLDRWGFYPVGEGRLKINIQPAPLLKGLRLLEWEPSPQGEVFAVVSKLPESIAERECEVIRRRAGWRKKQCHIWNIKDSAGPGNVVMIRIGTPQFTELFTSFGKKGVAAELVAKQAWDQVKDYLATRAPVGEYLCDQLLLPLSLAAGQGNPSEFLTGPLSQHSQTQIDLIQRFLKVTISVIPVKSNQYRVVIQS